MTETEIMKALECGVQYTIKTDVATYKGMPLEVFSKAVLDLINRKNAEIEQYKSDKYLYTEDGKFELLPRTDLDKIKAEARAEAIKEFAERLKAEKHECGCNFRKKPVYAVTMEKVDQIAKEMGVEL